MALFSHGAVIPTITGRIANHYSSLNARPMITCTVASDAKSSCVGVTLYSDAASAMLIPLYLFLQNMVMWRARIGWQQGMPEPNVSM